MKKIKSVMLIAVFSMTVGATCLAQTSDMLSLESSNNTVKPMKLIKPVAKNQCSSHKFRKSFARSWFMALRHTRQLTEAQAKIVAQAAVILYGDGSLSVGKVTPVKGQKHENYQIQIVNNKTQVKNTILMNGINGSIMRKRH